MSCLLCPFCRFYFYFCFVPELCKGQPLMATARTGTDDGFAAAAAAAAQLVPPPALRSMVSCATGGEAAA